MAETAAATRSNAKDLKRIQKKEERQGVAFDHVRILVVLETDPMAGPMEERLAVAFAVDRAASGAIDRLARDAWSDQPW